MPHNPVLIVDDEKNIRLTISQALESLKIPIETAINGEEALQKIKAKQFSVILLDLKMPGMNGIEVLRILKNQTPKTRVVIITAYGTIESAIEAMKLGAIDFIQKPFSPTEIRELVRQILAREDLDEKVVDDYESLIELTKRQITDMDFTSARATAQKAISLNQSRPEVYNLLGALNEIDGNFSEAKKFYRVALDIDESYQPAWANIERTSKFHKFGKIDLDERKAESSEQQKDDGNTNESK